jgi:glycosyltransferase involved in cell wall biosynthesis
MNDPTFNEPISYRQRLTDFLARHLYTGSVAKPRCGLRIAYYLEQFPTLSETFVRREIDGLRNMGLDICVVAKERNPQSFRIRELADHASNSHYLIPVTVAGLTGSLLSWTIRRPLRTFLLAVYLVAVDYGESKSLLSDGKMLALALLLASRLKELSVDSIHCPWSHKNANVALGAGRLLDVPVTMQARAFELHRDSSAEATIERLRRADGIMTNSRFNYNYIRSRLGEAGAKKLQWVYNSLPLNQPPRVDANRTSGKFHVLSIGRLVPKKGFETLIAAIAQLPADITVECRIIGGESPGHAEYKKFLEEQLTITGAKDRILFLGALPYSEVSSQYQWADVFVLASTVPENGDIDITPNVLLEAMAAGMPLISTSVGAIPELFQDGVSGLLAPADDAAQIARHLRRLEGDRDFARTMGQEGRKRAEKLFNPEINLPKLASFLNRE